LELEERCRRVVRMGWVRSRALVRVLRRVEGADDEMRGVWMEIGEVCRRLSREGPLYEKKPFALLY
jgi:hypothetical protein